MSGDDAVTNRPNGDGGRDASGRFAPGCKPGPGNPLVKRAFELRRELIESLPDGAIRAVAMRLARLAVEGDVTAAKLLLEHTVGRPTQAIELSGPDGGPLANLAAIQVVILDALADEPAAKIKVARALRDYSATSE